MNRLLRFRPGEIPARVRQDLADFFDFDICAFMDWPGPETRCIYEEDLRALNVIYTSMSLGRSYSLYAWSWVGLILRRIDDEGYKGGFLSIAFSGHAAESD